MTHSYEAMGSKQVQAKAVATSTQGRGRGYTSMFVGGGDGGVGRRVMVVVTIGMKRAGAAHMRGRL